MFCPGLLEYQPSLRSSFDKQVNQPASDSKNNNGLSLTVTVTEDGNQGIVRDPQSVTPSSLIEMNDFPPPPTDLGVFTESITKTTFTETTTTRVTNNQLKGATSSSSLDH